ncbi:MAG: hypothetical protein NZM43_09925 [Saprospiraceae bacterium]|nr:hypothetical protein [Saprospiraceae bacterium]MDW8484631.1 hypothetical protein [Saprospiraceae bacterium]
MGFSRKNLAVFLVALMVACSTIFGQQSNKSKSKDRYREKEQPSRATVEQQLEQWVPLRQLAEEELPRVLQVLSEISAKRFKTPSVACWYQTCALLAAYETMARYSTRTSSLRGVIEGMPSILSFVSADSVFYPFTALWAMLETGKVFREAEGWLSENQARLESVFLERGLPNYYLSTSKKAAQDIAYALIRFAQVNQNQRLLVLQSSDPLGWANPTPEDLREGSRYRVFVREIFERGGTNISEEHRRQVAAWWRTEPMSARWLTIAATVCAQQRLPFATMLRILTATSIAMADAYTWCVNESRQYVRSAPRVAVNQLFDPNWQPINLTVPDELCSRECGLIPAAAASVLSQMVGERIAFLVDERSYASFREAAREAGMAHFYAGRHLRDIVEAGLVSGEQIGILVVQRWPKEP